jgi:hypothetical protein
MAHDRKHLYDRRAILTEKPHSRRDVIARNQIKMLVNQPNNPWRGNSALHKVPRLHSKQILHAPFGDTQRSDRLDGSNSLGHLKRREAVGSCDLLDICVEKATIREVIEHPCKRTPTVGSHLAAGKNVQCFER